MCQFAFLLFFVSVCIFAGIMMHDARTLWSGASFLIMVVCLSVFLLMVLYQYSEWLAEHDLVIGILIIIFALAVGAVVLFPVSLILVFFVEGIRVIRHEGIKPTNLLSMLFSVLLCIYLVVCPVIGNLGQNTLGTMPYTIVSCIAVYVLSLLAMQSSASNVGKSGLKHKLLSPVVLISLSNPITYPKPFLTNCAAL